MGMLSPCTNGYWAVDGQPLYVPDEVDIGNDNIVSSDSGRLESGYTYIRWVRPTVRKVTLTYKHLTGYEKDYLHNLMQGRVFMFTYWDNGIQVMEAYAGKDDYKQKNLSNYADEGGEYSDYKVSIVEM